MKKARRYGIYVYAKNYDTMRRYLILEKLSHRRTKRRLAILWDALANALHEDKTIGRGMKSPQTVGELKELLSYFTDDAWVCFRYDGRPLVCDEVRQITETGDMMFDMERAGTIVKRLLGRVEP